MTQKSISKIRGPSVATRSRDVIHAGSKLVSCRYTTSPEAGTLVLYIREIFSSRQHACDSPPLSSYFPSAIDFPTYPAIPSSPFASIPSKYLLILLHSIQQFLPFILYRHSISHGLSPSIHRRSIFISRTARRIQRYSFNFRSPRQGIRETIGRKRIRATRSYRERLNLKSRRNGGKVGSVIVILR